LAHGKGHREILSDECNKDVDLEDLLGHDKGIAYLSCVGTQKRDGGASVTNWPNQNGAHQCMGITNKVSYNPMVLTCNTFGAIDKKLRNQSK